MIMLLPLCPPAEKDTKLAQIREKTTNRYLPAFEKDTVQGFWSKRSDESNTLESIRVLKSHGQEYLVGNRLSRADVHLVELLYYVEEVDPSLLASFPLLKVVPPLALGGQAHLPLLAAALWALGRKSICPLLGHVLFAALCRVESCCPTDSLTQGGCIETLATIGPRALQLQSGFEEELFETLAEFEKLIQGGILMYEEVPMVEMDGMNLVETRAILRYIAAKYDLYGRTPKEQAWIDMYAEGLKDLSDMVTFLPLSLPGEKEMNLQYILERATTRFFPVYEKALRDRGQDFLVGDRQSWTDVQLLEVIFMVEECKPKVLSGFPLLQDTPGGSGQCLIQVASGTLSSTPGPTGAIP
ncbi:hypothetical protein CB1_000602006 [Camelus ferus]|nr:hypothetical protein CB1_000602006 [Camelus ferus]